MSQSKFAQEYSSLDVINALFEKVGEKTWRCTLCHNAYKQGNGWNNLKSHVANAHTQRWEAIVRKYVEDKIPELTMDQFTAKTDSMENLFNWIAIIVMMDLPFYFVEHKLMRKFTALRPICTKTLKAGIQKLYNGVLKAIEELLPEFFGLIEDDWSNGNGAHLMGVIATFQDKKTKRHVKILLGVNQLVDPTNQTAVNHRNSLEAVLAKFGRGLENLLFIVADTAATNKACARLIGVPLVPCHSHLLALATKIYCKPHAALLQKVHRVLHKLHVCSNMRQKLLRRTTISPKMGCVTRWDFAWIETKSYLQLAPFLEAYGLEIGGLELAHLMLTVEEREQLTTLNGHLRHFHAATVYLQHEDISFAEVRSIFNELLLNFVDCEGIKPYLTPYGAKIPNPQFLAGVTKIQQGRLAELSPGELDAVEDLKLLVNPVPTVAVQLTAEEEEQLDVVEKAQLRAKRSRVTDNYMEVYGDLMCVTPTSCEIERTFSRTKLIYRDRRQRMSINTLEMLTVLRFNRDLWSPSMLREAVAEAAEDDSDVPDLISDSDDSDDDAEADLSAFFEEAEDEQI